jgi:signal transduction histidine kinase
LFQKPAQEPHDSKNVLWAYLRFGWPILGLIAIMGLVCALLLADLTRSQDRTFVANSRNLIQQAIQSHIESNALYAIEYSLWDDAYQNTTLKLDTQWLASNFNAGNSGAVGVYREGVGLRYLYVREGLESTRSDIEAFSKRLSVAAHRPYLTSRDLDDVVSSPKGLEVFNGRLAAVAMQPIRPEGTTDLPKPKPGAPTDFVIFISYIDASVAQNIGRASGLQAPELHISDVAQPPRSGRIGLDMTNGAGELIARIDWVDTKPGSAEFMRRSMPVGLALLVLGLSTLIVTYNLSARERALSERARKAAEEASIQKSSFLASVSHELRTPLNAIIGYSEILYEDCRDANNDMGAQDAGKVTKAANHLLALINDLLDHSKIEAGKMDLNPAQMAIARILEDVCEALTHSALERGNRLILHFDPNIGQAMLDGMRLKQCLLNITSNAIKFTRDGTITLQARGVVHDGVESLRFTIKDTGIGMSAETLSRLFVPFVQADASTSARFGGTGLGLVITKRLAEAMGGQVQVDSTEGAGSVFTLIIPRGLTDQIGGDLDAAQQQTLAA